MSDSEEAQPTNDSDHIRISVTFLSAVIWDDLITRFPLRDTAGTEDRSQNRQPMTFSVFFFIKLLESPTSDHNNSLMVPAVAYRNTVFIFISIHSGQAFFDSEEDNAFSSTSQIKVSLSSRGSFPLYRTNSASRQF
jgi:hypothetical protein